MPESENSFASILGVIQTEFKKSKNRPFIIAIDGRGGSGKSTFAKELEKNLENSILIEREKFMYFMEGMDVTLESWNHQNFAADDAELKKEILKNSQQNFIILEGLKTFELQSNLKIWMEIDPNIADERAKKRDVSGQVNPVGFENFWSDYKKYANSYIASFNPKSKADLVISTSENGYNLVVDRTEWRPEVFQYQEQIKNWWAETFPEQKLETIEVANHGINCSYILNSELVLKILKPKYSWYKTSRDEGKDKIQVISNYSHIQKINLQLAPNILMATYSDILQAHFIVSKYLKSQNLYEIYYKLSHSEKAEYLKKFIDLVKNFHSACPNKIHGDLHFGNILVKDSQLYLIDFDNMLMPESEASFASILAIIQTEFKKSKNRPFIIAIDGRSGGGKSTFAKKLEEKLSKTKRINLDAFTIRSGDFFAPELIQIKHQLDWENTEYQIKKILAEIQNSNFEIFVLEGAFSFKNLGEINFDLKIFVDCQKEIAADRLNNREIEERTEIAPEIIKNSTHQWQLAEDRYYTSFNPKSKADLVISTSETGYKLI